MSFANFNLSELKTEQPLNILCHRQDIEVVNDRPDVMEITAEDTLAMVAKFTPRTWAMAKLDEDFKLRLKMVFPDLDITAEPRDISEYPIGYRHVVGLIICTNKAINTGKSPFWRLPETHLHPSSQAGLATLAISYSKLVEDMNKAIADSRDNPSV